MGQFVQVNMLLMSRPIYCIFQVWRQELWQDKNIPKCWTIPLNNDVDFASNVFALCPLVLTLRLFRLGFRSWHWRADWGGCRSSQHMQAGEEGLIPVQAEPPVHSGSTEELHQPLTETYEHTHTHNHWYNQTCTWNRGEHCHSPTP